MNRKIIVLLILIGLFGIIGVASYAYVSGMLVSTESEVSSEQSEVSSEQSEVSSEQSEVSSEQSELESEVIEPGTTVKSETEGVDTEIPADPEGESDAQVGDNVDVEYDENGDLREDSKYLDDDGDTVANYFDICPDVDDFSSDCETDAYSAETETAETDSSESTSSDLDENGVARDESTYLDDDGDTVANFYDICPGVDDFSSECETDAYN